MQTNDHLTAVLLLTTHLGEGSEDRTKPLSVSEWARFATWLKDNMLEPASLLSTDAPGFLERFVDRSISSDRIRRLLDRGGALGLSHERWERAGLWIVTRSDREYPDRLKRRLGRRSPAVLFGVGSRAQLNSRGIAVVGSRNASDEDNAFAEAIGQDAASQQTTIISGGARGIDRSAMLGAVQADGMAVGILADNLLRSATSSIYRKHLMENRLTLISPYNPEIEFRTANAMERNQYIYCLSEAAIVVSSSFGKGGTWAGAIENLRKGWVPLWVKSSADPSSGNSELVKQGGHYLPGRPFQMNQLSESRNHNDDRNSKDPDCSAELPPVQGLKEDKYTAFTLDAATQTPIEPQLPPAPASENVAEGHFEYKSEIDKSMFEVFLVKLTTLTREKPLSADEIAKELELTKTQSSAWLKRALADQLVRRTARPARYQVIATATQQPSLFDERC